MEARGKTTVFCALPVLVWAILSLSCSAPAELDLAVITRVSPEVVESGRPLIVEGDGFGGDNPSVILSGEWLPVGARRPVRLEAVLPAHPESDRVLKAFPDPFLRRQWEGSEAVAFRGTVTVRVGGQLGQSIAGRTGPLELRFSMNEEADLLLSFLRRRSDVFLEHWGIRVAFDESRLGVASVKPQGRADQLGLKVLDVIERIDRWPIRTREDLGWLSTAASSRFDVLRNGAPLTLENPYSLFLPEMSREMVGALVLAGLVLGIFMSLAVLSRTSPTPGHPFQAPQAGFPIMVLIAMFLTALAALVPSFQKLSRMRVDLGAVLMAILCTGLLAEGIARFRSEGPSFRHRLLGLARRLGGVLPALALLVVYLAGAGAASLNEALFDGAGLATAWGILENPFGTVLHLAVLSLWARLLHPLDFSLQGSGPWALAGRIAANASFSMLFVITGLGAWGSPTYDIPGPALEGILFAAKAWCVILAALLSMPRAERRRRQGLITDAVVTAVFLGSFAAAVLWALGPVPDALLKTGRLAAIAILALWAGAQVGRFYWRSGASHSSPMA